MKYELEFISNITSSTKGKTKILIKNAKIKKIFDLDKVDLQTFIDGRTGKEIKKYSSVYEDTIFYKVNKPYEELKDIILNIPKPILGLMSKSKLCK